MQLEEMSSPFVHLGWKYVGIHNDPGGRPPDPHTQKCNVVSLVKPLSSVTGKLFGSGAAKLLALDYRKPSLFWETDYWTNCKRKIKPRDWLSGGEIND